MHGRGFGGCAALFLLATAVAGAETYQDASGRFVVKTELATERRTLEAFIARLRTALAYTVEALGWKDTGALRQPLSVQVLSSESIRRRFPGASAFSRDGTIFLPQKALDPDSGFDGVHEMVHVLVGRMGGRLPRHVGEGLAMSISRRYALRPGGPADGAWSLRRDARFLAGMTGADARRLVRDLATGNGRGRDGRLQHQGGLLFVEFLRTRLGGHGAPDALRRLASVAENAPRGRRKGREWRQAFDREFDAHFGVPPARADSLFVEYVEKTEGDPTRRFAGTLLAGYE
jgi:hypothetical protein